MTTLKEADWKQFRELRPLALERLCQRILQTLANLSADADKTYHQRYLEIYQYIREQDREIALGFNHGSRKEAFDQLLFFHSRSLVTDEELTRFSPDLRGTIIDIASAANRASDEDAI